MSKGCGNPYCPSHGETAEAKALKDAKSRIAACEELMGVIRILAANSDDAIARKVKEHEALFLTRQIRIIKGDYDSHPMVQGIMNGFAVLLIQHPETQSYFNLLRQVPEDKGFMAKARAEAQQIQAELAGDPFADFSFQVGSIEELMAFLKGFR